ncbi:MAG: fatty acid desaturase family protein [Pseudomonadota bacterium]
MTSAPKLSPLDVFTAEEWEGLRARQSWRGLALIAHAWGLIALAMGLVAVWPNPLTIALAVMVVGARQLGLAILMHEAAHGGLHPNAKLNDRLGQWLCAAPVGAHLQSYRSYHLAHHRYVQQAEDPDLLLTAPFPVSPASLRRKIFRDLTGQTFIKQRLASFRALFLATGTVSGGDNGQKDDQDAMAPQRNGVVDNRRGVRDHLIFNAGFALVLTLAGYGWLYLVAWLLPMATWFPFATRLRNIGEHAGLNKSNDPLALARTTHAAWWERLLIAPYWVHYHAEHHAFMHLPCYRLRAAHERLCANGHGGRIPQAQSYGEILGAVVRV